MSATLQALRTRCQIRHHAVQAANLLQLFSRTAWPGLAVLLAVGVVVEQFHGPLPAVFAAIGLWLLGSAVWAARLPEYWRIPAWRPAAWLDRHAAARGVLLTAYEQGHVPASGLPTTTHVRFPALFQPEFFIGWTLLLVAYLAWWWMPSPATPLTIAPQTYIPQPVQKLSNALDLLKEQRPPDDPFTNTAEQTLNRLKQRNNTLEQADLHALKQLETQTRQQLSNSLTGLQQTAAELDQFEQLLQQLDASKTPSAELLEQMQALNNALQNTPGLSPEQLESLVKQMEALQEAMAQQQAGAPEAQPFSQERIQQLQQQMQQYRQQLAQAQKSTRQVLQRLSEGNAITRGPGHESLDYDHLTFQRNNTDFDNSTFKGNPGQDTVLLGKGLTKREETGQVDTPVAPPPTFDAGATTPYRQKQVLPRHRETLEKYFDQLDSTESR